MATNKEEDKLALYIDVNEVLKNFYNYIVHAFEHVRNKSLALLIGEVAIVTFLFQGFSLFHKNASGKTIHIPIFEIVIFGIGIALLITSFVLYLLVLATAKWQFPTEEHDMKNPSDRFKDSSLKFQMYLHEEYMQKVVKCNTLLSKRSKLFMLGTYTLSAGIFIIILIKYGGGA